MSSLLSLVQIKLSPSCDNIFLMIKIMIQDLKYAHDLGLVIDKGQHDNTKGILHLCMLEKKVEYNIGICITPQLYDYPHTFTVALVSQIRDPVYLFVLYEISYVFYEICLVYHIGKLGHDDLLLAVWKFFYLCYGTASDLSSSGPVCFFNSTGAKDFSSCRKIRSLYYIEDIFYRCL